MADSVVKLRVDSQEYDAKIKRASDGVRAFGENCRKAGESVSKADQDTITYVRSLGQMDTVSKNVKGKISEMTNAFTELSVQYKQLTDEEKQSPFGQALASSLDQLKTRINESKAQLTEINSELGNTSAQSNETGGILDNLAGKFGLNVTQAGALGVALGAATAATKVAKDAFFANEEQLDEWGRTVAASESLYRGFLNALNNGDISGYLSKINTIAQAARDAYNALDELATYNAFNQINVEKTRFALSESINDFREGKGTKEGVKSAGDAVIKELRTRQQKETNAYKAAVGKLAAERGVSQKDLLDALSGDYGHYSDLKGLKPTGKRTVVYGGGMFGGGGSYEVAMPETRAQQIGQALRKINDDELQKLQAIGAQAERTGIEIEGVNRQVIRTMNARTGTGSGGGGGRVRTTPSAGGGRGGHTVTGATPPPAGSIAAQEAKVQALTKAWREATDEAGRNGYAGQLEEAKKVLEQMQGKNIDIVPKGSLKDLSNQMRDLQAKRENLADPIQIKVVDDQIAELKRDIDALNSGDVLYFSLKVQEDELTARLDDLKAKKDLLEDPASIRIVNDDIKRVQAELDEANKKKIETKVEIDTTELETELAHLQEMRDLLSKPVEISVIVKDIEDVESQIENLRNQRNPVEKPNQPPTISLEQKVALSIAEDNIDTDIQTLTNLLRVKIENGLDDLDIPAEHLQRAILGGEGFDSINIPDEYWQHLVDEINTKLADLGIDPITLDVESGKVSKAEEEKPRESSMESVKKAIGGISQIASGFNQMGVKVPESVGRLIGIMQGLITVIEGVQTVISIFSATSQAVNTAAVTANTVAVGALTTAMLTNTATNFIPFFNTGGVAHAAGGLLTGHHYSNDQVPVMVNDGELILNRAQQGVIADALDGGATPKIIIEGELDGEKLRLVQRNSNRMRGRGEYVTTKSR